MTPINNSVILDEVKAGYPSYKVATINPSELEYWRVIRKNTNGTVDVISEYVSSVNVNIYGANGYARFVGYLNELASYYEHPKYTIGSRMMGYDGQTQSTSAVSNFDGRLNTAPSTTSTPNPTTGIGKEYWNRAHLTADTLYLTDYLLVQDAYGNNGDSSLISKTVSNKSTATKYWIASRRFVYQDDSHFFFYGRIIDTDGSLGNKYSLSQYNGGQWYTDSYDANAIRPILTLKSTVTSSGTETLNGETVYVLG